MRKHTIVGVNIKMDTKFLLIIFLLVVQIFASDSKVNKNDVLEIYFDTPDLYLLKNDLILKYQAKEYISKKKNKIKYYESIIYISKSKEKHTFKAKHYNSVKSIEEKHPLLSLVKRADRKLFMDLLHKDGIEYPMKLKYVLENNRYSKEKPNDVHSYKMLFDKSNGDDPFFSMKFQYPYFMNLFYAICFGLIGFILIKVLFNKRLKEKIK